ncbi:MAG: helix-turn-helix transcriptional regulator [Candidatus Omnitrophica bacterium]|nr:helix-turn-helix transcriptional regulator [Candidatus Omnitrophota bacterium]
MTSLQQQIGSRIKELRQLKGYTQAELAELTDLSTNYIGYVERGDRTISLQMLERLARTLGVEVGTFFLFHPQKLNRVSRDRDRKSQLVAKVGMFLQRAEGEDLKLFVRLARRLSLTRSP